MGLLSTCFHSLGAKLKPINRLWKPEKHGFEVAVAAVLSATSTTRDAAILTKVQKVTVKATSRWLAYLKL